MRVGLISLALILGALGGLTTGRAQTPTPGTATPSPLVSMTAVPSATSTASTSAALPTQPTEPPKPFTVASTLIEDNNANGILDQGDAPIRLSTLVQLVPWSQVPPGPGSFAPPTQSSGSANLAAATGPEIGVLTADGSFSFVNVPVGDYTLRVWWEAGFPSGGSATIPDVYQAVFTVTPSGGLSAPAAPSSEWKGLRGQQTDLQREVGSVGTVPAQILLNQESSRSDSIPGRVGWGFSSPELGHSRCRGSMASDARRGHRGIA